MSVSEVLNFVRAQKAVELFPDGGVQNMTFKNLDL